MKTLLLQNESENTLNQLIEFAKKLGIKTSLIQDSDWWDELSNDEKNEIKLGLSQAKNNNFIDNEDVMNQFNKWH